MDFNSMISCKRLSGVIHLLNSKLYLHPMTGPNHAILVLVLTVESSLFMGDQCSWFYARIYIPTNMLLFLMYINITQDQIIYWLPTKYSPKNQQILVSHEHWPPQIKIIPQYKVSIWSSLPVLPPICWNAVWCVSYQLLGCLWNTDFDSRLLHLLGSWNVWLVNRHMILPLVYPGIHVCRDAYSS
jgi:hypothetical protein